MAYFPRAIMPLTPKEQSPLAGRGTMTAPRYNTHDEEIRAIEEFVGASDLYAAGTGVAAGILERANAVISKLNALVDPAGGISVSSGMVRSGNRVIFPEPCMGTFLLTVPGSNDSSITVSSTAGFPDQGVISILNEMDERDAQRVGFTNVEWIRYSSKTTQSFEGCERGYGGTYAGSHALSPAAAMTTKNNLLDYPGDVEHDTSVHRAITTAYAEDGAFFTRHFAAWRRMDVYEIKILGLYGTMTDLAWKVQRRAALFRVLQTDADFTGFADLTGGLGLLRQRDDGSYYLESNDVSYALQGVLTWEEANAVVDGLYDTTRGVNGQYWPAYVIPVFYGRLSLTLSIAGTTRDAFDPMDGMRLRQAATGDVYVFNYGTFVPTYGDVNYHATLVGSQMQQPEMDMQPNSKGMEEPDGGTT